MKEISKNLIQRTLYKKIIQKYRSTLAADIPINDEVFTKSYDEVRPYYEIPGPTKIPIFGTSYLYHLGPYDVKQYHKVLQDLHKKYGPVVRQNFAGQEVIHIFDLEDVKTVLYNTGKSPAVPPIQEGSFVYRQKKNHSVGLGNLNGQEWYTMRSAVQKMMLKPLEVQHYLSEVDSVTNDFVRYTNEGRQENGEITDFHTRASRWFLECAGEILFESRLGCMDVGESEEKAQRWIEANKNIFYYNAILKVATPLYKYFPVKAYRRLEQAEEYFHKAAGEHIKGTITKINNLNKSNKLEGQYRFMSYLLSCENLTVKDISFMAHSLISEGLSTVPAVMLNSIYSLAKNPRVQEKLHEEIDAAADRNSPVTVDVLNKLPYLKAAVKETFRMFPLGTEVSRILQKDMVLGGYYIPAGTCVDLNHSSQLKSEKYFPEPLQYLPDRWLRKDDDTTNRFILTPFGHGSRMCVGRRFALQNIYVGLLRILQNYQVTCSKEQELGQTFNTLLFPDRPVTIKLIRR